MKNLKYSPESSCSFLQNRLKANFCKSKRLGVRAGGAKKVTTKFKFFEKKLDENQCGFFIFRAMKNLKYSPESSCSFLQNRFKANFCKSRCHSMRAYGAKKVRKENQIFKKSFTKINVAPLFFELWKIWDIFLKALALFYKKD